MKTQLPCPPELWPAFSALLDEAIDIPDAERPRWLAALGPEYAAVRPWLAKLFRADTETAAARLRAPVADLPAESEFQRGESVGPYVLHERLGSGGMGEVWLASRGDGTLNRQVALKLPHVHLMAGVLRRRFERERDILAGLSHPHIAQLYDAGVADAQRPYLAMEWVDGVAIHHHCRDTAASLDERLELFLQILDAVAYAHGRLIAHRDLKPSNILVTRDGRVKLLDFGIAKLLIGDTDGAATQLTRIGSCMATPGYAAPEQLAGQPITAAVDLYALGVLLLELLTGRRPGGDGRAARNPLSGTPRASSLIEPGHGTRVGGLTDAQLRRALQGDLDAITAKALQADPANRYRSAEAFARDIKLSRQDRPISARRISAATLTLKFLRRHWVGSALTGGLVLALLGGSAGIAWQAVRAEREAQRATTIKDFLVNVFRASDPRIAADKPRGEITARELLDASAQKIEGGFARQPATEIELLGVSADIYRELDETRRSTALYRREVELARKYLGPNDVHVIEGLLGEASNSDENGDDADALALLGETDPLIRSAGLERSALRAHWLLLRGEALMDDASRGPEAQRSLSDAAALFDAVAPLDPRYVETLSDLGALLLEQSQFAASADYYRRAVAAARKAEVPGDLLLAYGGLALALKRLGDADGAGSAFTHGAEIAARTYGTDGHEYWLIASDWAQFRYERGERSAALDAFEGLTRTLPSDRSAFRNATDALEAAQVLRKFARCLATDGQAVRAISLVERAQVLLKSSAPHPADAATLDLDMARAYEAGGRMEEARTKYRSALMAFNNLNFSASQRAVAHERWGRFLLLAGDIEGAGVAFREVLRLSGPHASDSSVYAQGGLAAIAIANGDGPAAVEASSRAIEQMNRIEGHYDVRIRPYLWTIHARALLLQGDRAGARAFAERAYAATLNEYAPGSHPILEAGAILESTPRHAGL